MRAKQHIPLYLIAILAWLAASLVAYSTVWGPWAGSDSALYLARAHNIAHGEGFGVLLPSGDWSFLMAPVYPLVLGGLTSMKITPVDAARWLDIILFGLTILTAGVGFYRLSHSRWLGVPFSLLLAIFPVMFKIFTMAMTEPLFLFAMLVALFLLTAALDHKSRRWMIAAAAMAGIATLVRFIGVTFLPVGIAALLFLQSTPWKRRATDAIIFSVIYSLPILIWLIWLSSKPVASPVRSLALGNLWDYLQPVRAGLVDIMWEWVPFQANFPVYRYASRFLGLLISLVMIFLMPILASIKLHKKNLKKWIADRDGKLFGVMALFVIGYLTTFIFIYIFRTPSPDINERTLLPLYPPLLGMLFAAFSLLQRAFIDHPRRDIRRIIVTSLPWLVLAIAVAAYAPQTAALAREYHQIGAGYSSAAWQASQTIQAITKLPEDIPIISNEAGAILFHTGRFALEIPELYAATQPALEAIDLSYGDNLTDPSQRVFREEGAALVLFQPSFYWQLYTIYTENADLRMEAITKGLTISGEYPDGSIYFYPTEK